nr:hypothetical protein [Candidatus Sigynarchaeota archaeon]
MSPGDPRFTSNILVVTPNRTVRQRDYTALDPTHEENYYMSFNLVPNSLHKFLFQGNIFITNWHYFLLKDDSGTKSVVKKGKESKEAFVRRVTTQGFTRFYRNKKIFVLNDEAHHAYRPSPDAIDKLRKEQERKLLNKVQEFEELIQAIDQGPEHLEKLKQSSVKKDNDLAKKIEKISKSEEIELRRKIKDFHELYEVSIVADALIKGDAHLKTMSTSKNPQDRDVVKKIQAMSDAERKAIKGRYEELGSTMLEMLSETLSLDNDLVEATVWVGGLDLINNVVGINFCVDLTATPFYNKDSGFPEGTPFPWIVTDFSLADAIESGLVKIPRYPIKDNAAEEEARYYRLWETI